MRKVKLLALLLAVLMVVTAFAGCANTDVIESDVANLDERVTALENLLNGIDKELDDTNAKLEDTNKKLEDTNAKIEEVDSKIDKLDETLKGDKTDEEIATLKAQLDAQKASLDAQAKLLEEQTKTLQEQAKTAEAQKKAIEDQLKVLENQAAAQNKTNEELLATIQQMLKDQADKEAAEKAEAEAEKALNSAKTAALLQIAGIEGANPGKYILQIAIAKATVESASTVEAANKAVTDLNAAIEIAKGEEAAAAAAALAAAKETANTQITIIENANPGKYATEIANAKAAVEAATTTAEVAKAVTDLSAAIAKADQDAADAAAAAAAAALKAAKDGALVEIAAVEAANAGKYADLFVAAKAAVEAATTAEAATKAVTDLKAGVEAKKAAEAAAEAAAATAAALAAAQKTASGDIAVIREQKAADKVLYFATDYQAIVKALATAEAAVAAAKTADEVGAAVATLNAELAKYVAIDDALYAFVDGLWKNLSEANRPLYNEMVAYMEKIEQEFEITSTLDEIAFADKQMDIIQYVYGEDANGDKKVVNLIDMVEYLYAIYGNLAGQDNGMVTIDAEFDYNSASYRTYSEITSDIVTYNLAKATEEAKKLDTRINDFLTNENYKENYAFLRAADSFSMFGDLNDSYDTFMDNTKIFAASVRALVSKLSEVERLKGIINNYIAAEKALLELGIVNFTTQTVLNVFEEHGYTAHDSVNNPFYDVEDKTFTTKVVFDPIDAEIASWTSAYKLSAEDSTAIIEATYTKAMYDEYKTDKAYVKLMDDKFAAFKKDIVPLITALAGEKNVAKSAFEAYKNLDAKLDAWASAKVSNKYNYVNTTNLELMFALLGEDFAGITLYDDTQTSGNIGYQATTDIAAIDCLQLVDFKYSNVEYFFENEFATFKADATAINNAVKALAKDLTDRKLYSILPILAIEDKTIVLDGETYLAMSDATALLALKDYTGALAYEYSADGSTEGVVGYYSYISDVVSGAPSVTIREFEEACDAKGYADLAAYLIEYSKYDKLKSDFEKRIKDLLDNGATKFIADVKAIAAVTLANNDIAANPGDRLYTTNYNKYSSGDKVYYVTLADEAKYDVAKATLSKWVTDFAGRTEYQEVVSKEIKFKIENKAGEKRELTYAGGFGERDILQGYDTIYGNIAGQMKVLQNARTAITDIMTVVESAMAFANLEGAGYDLSEGLDNAVVIGYSVASNGKVTVKEVTGYADGEFTIAEKTFNNAAAVTYTGSYTIGDMIQDAYTATVAFNLLNADWKSDKKLNTATASALDSIKVDGKAISAIVSELVLFYAKADLIAQLEVYAEETDNKAYIADAAIESIAKCTLLQGTTASAVSNWHEYLAAYFDLDVPALDGMKKADSNTAVEEVAIALYTVVLNRI